jgi:nitroreductase
LTLRLPPRPQLGDPLAVNAAPGALEFLASRRSASALTLTGPGPTPEELAELLRLAARVPDHGKLAPWRFIVLEGAGKAAFADRLEAIATQRADPAAATKLGKLRTPPLAIAVISSPRPGAIPEWEQQLSAGAVCATLLYATLAMGYGANWITDWYAYDREARAVLGLSEGERVAGFILAGTSREPPLERERADAALLTTHWKP